MTEASFRKLALSMPHAIEGSHMGHADFRVNDKIFATLPFEGDEDAKGNLPGGVAVVKLTPEQQSELVEAHPAVFEPVPGGWGRRGYTRILLRAASLAIARRATKLARNNLSAASA